MLVVKVTFCLDNRLFIPTINRIWIWFDMATDTQSIIFFLSQLCNIFWNFVTAWSKIICYFSSTVIMKRKNLLTSKDCINRSFIFSVIFIRSKNTIVSFFSFWFWNTVSIVSWLRPVPNFVSSMQSKLSIAPCNKLLLIEFDIGTRYSPSPFNKRFVNVKSILSSLS